MGVGIQLVHNITICRVYSIGTKAGEWGAIPTSHAPLLIEFVLCHNLGE